MDKKAIGPEGNTPGQQPGTESYTNHLRFYNIINTGALQAPVYPPGWLINRIRQAPPVNPITRRQGPALLNLIRAITLPAYREYKTLLGIPLDTPIHRLSKGQAWRLIHHITTDLEAQNDKLPD